jgi:hypothetical protein
MPQIILEVTESALANFKKVVETATGLTVTDPLALVTAMMKADVEEDLETFAYTVVDAGDALYEFDWPGLDKNV